MTTGISETVLAVYNHKQKPNLLGICESIKAIETPRLKRGVSIDALVESWNNLCQFDSILRATYSEICWLKGRFLIQAKNALKHGKYEKFCTKVGVGVSTSQNWKTIADPVKGFTRPQARSKGVQKMLQELGGRKETKGTNNGNGKKSKRSQIVPPTSNEPDNEAQSLPTFCDCMITSAKSCGTKFHEWWTNVSVTLTGTYQKSKAISKINGAIAACEFMRDYNITSIKHLKKFKSSIEKSKKADMVAMTEPKNVKEGDDKASGAENNSFGKQNKKRGLFTTCGV